MEKLVFDVDDLVLSKTLQTILDLMDECILIVDKEGRIIFFNRANEKLDNLKREEVLGRHLTECYKIREETSATLQVLRKHIPVLDCYQDYTTESENHIISVSSAYPLMQEEELIGALTITKDIYRFRKLMNIIDDREKPIKKDPDDLCTFERMIGKSRALMNCIQIARKVAATSSPMLIYGDTGTGKELFAQSVHHASNRKGPFISVNCAAMPESLLESILFGTAKGAFTGALERSGLFEEAANGTLFLDELNSMSLSQQAKLLRVLETNRVRRVGENKEREVKVRVISALNVSPIEAVQQGFLRQDLFYRLSVINMRIPSLAERKEDIPLLTKYFIEYYNRLFLRTVQDVSPEVAQLFMEYEWPGNVRELRHTIEYAMNIVEEEKIITREYLSALFHEQVTRPHQEEKIPAAQALSTNMGKKNLKSFLEGVELEAIRRVLNESNGNVNEAARRLGLSRQNLDYKLKKFHL